MSTSVLPLLAGLTWPVQRTPVWGTTVQLAISGKETRIARQSSPRWKWELPYSVLRSAAAYTELQQLAGFFNARQGMFDTFLYQDADDNSVTGQGIGTGDGSTTSFPLVRSFGGFVEPVLAYNVISNLYLGGASIPAGGIAAPSTPSLSSISSGSLAGTTYYVRTTYLTASGETASSPEASLAVAANHVVAVTSPAAETGATGWNVYVSTSSTTETKQNGSPIPIGSGWSEPNTGLISGAAFPVTNTTGFAVSNWGSSNPGIITFQGAPAASTAITADFTYYWPCRMSDDSLPFELFLTGFYSAKKFSFISVKN